MFIIIALVALFGLLALCHRHSGPAHLAAIAGVEVYRSFGGWLNDTVLSSLDDPVREVIVNAIYLLLIFAFPMLLYFRSHPKTHGAMHIVESAIFAILLVSLVAPALTTWVSYDDLSKNIINIIDHNIQYIIIAGIITAYLDILVYKKGHRE
ncbi:MAG: hypothetical protein LBQ02_01230 [Candidatus Nomurabacteria bacterium]|jgi:hypothetical protein|nr:hypothetical protein [Candidatus Nomurabacteria bacterium]